MNPQHPAVSVVIPVHNGARTLLRTIRSVQMQTHPVHEIIVVDDHSTDDLATAVRSAADPRVRCVSADGRGAAHARNVGVKLASGPYIAFVDADDVWYPDKLEVQLPLLLDPGVVIAGVLVHYLGEHGQVLGTYVPFTSTEAATASLRRGETMPVSLAFSLIRRSDFLAAGGFDETFRRTQDLELAQRLVQFGRTVAWPPDRALGGYVIHQGGVSAQSYREQFLAAELVRARVAGRTTADYAHWQTSPELTPSAHRRLRSGAHYRQAGVAVGDHRWVAAVAHGLASLLIDGGGTVEKLRLRRRNVADLTPTEPPPEVRSLFRP